MLGIDQRDLAGRHFARAKLRRIDANGIAELQRERVPLRYAQAQHERLFADRGDRVAIQHHRPLGQWHGDHAAGHRCQHLALLQVLQRHGTLGGARAQDRGGDIHRGARLLHRGARAATLTQQRLGPRRDRPAPARAATAVR